MAVGISWWLGDRGGRGVVVGRVVEVDGDVFDDGGAAFRAEVRSGGRFADVETPVQEGIVDELGRGEGLCKFKGSQGGVND